MSEPHFDRYSWDPRIHNRKWAVNLSYQDRESFQTHRHATHRYLKAPAWVWNDKLVRRVIAAQIARTAGLTTVPEADLNTLRKVSEAALAKLKTHKDEESHKLARAVEKIGLPAYYAALIYLTYRAGCDSVACAMQLHVSPFGVRQTLFRLRKTAKLCLESPANLPPLGNESSKNSA